MLSSCRKIVLYLELNHLFVPYSDAQIVHTTQFAVCPNPKNKKSSEGLPNYAKPVCPRSPLRSSGDGVAPLGVRRERGG